MSKYEEAVAEMVRRGYPMIRRLITDYGSMYVPHSVYVPDSEVMPKSFRKWVRRQTQRAAIAYQRGEPVPDANGEGW